jgi:hypothetical protein
MPPKIAAIPREALGPLLQNTPLSGQDIRALLRSKEWTRLESRNAQVAFLAEFAEFDCGIRLPSTTIADVFGLTASRVRTICIKAKKPEKPPYRPLTLSVDKEGAVCRMILEGARTGNYVTQRQVLRFVETEFHKVMTYGWLDGFLKRHARDVRRVVVEPQELPRRQIPRVYLERYLDLIKIWVPLVPAELIFNMDETGLSDWEERKPKPVLVPATMEDTTFHYPVDRGIRHQTLLCCVSASGDAYCPLLVCSRAEASSVFEMGVREDIDLKIKIQPSPYINKELFLEYLRDAFIPTVESNRQLPGCQGKPAILFCDNCSSHCSEDILKELSAHGILLLTYPPHSSHVFQVLDVLLFGNLKSAKKYLPRDTSASPIVDHVLRVFRAYEQVTTSTTVRASWQKAGFGFVRRDGTYYLWVDEAKIRGSPEFSEIWNIDYPEEALPMRRRQQKWGWLNEATFRVEFHEGSFADPREP